MSKEKELEKELEKLHGASIKKANIYLDQILGDQVISEDSRKKFLDLLRVKKHPDTVMYIKKILNDLKRV